MVQSNSTQSNPPAHAITDVMSATYDAADRTVPNQLLTNTYDADNFADTSASSDSSSGSSSGASNTHQNAAMTATFDVAVGSSVSSRSYTVSPFPYTCPRLLLEEHHIRMQWRLRCELEDDMEGAGLRIRSLEGKAARSSIRMLLFYRSLANTERRTQQSILERLCHCANQMNAKLQIGETMASNIQLLAHRVAVGQIRVRDALKCAVDLSNGRLSMPQIWLRYQHVRPTRGEPQTVAENESYLRAERSAAIEMYVHLWLVMRCSQVQAERSAKRRHWSMLQ